MNETKKLGRGLEDISHLFLSSMDKNTPAEEILFEDKERESATAKIATKSICIVGDSNLGFQDAFFVINLSLALSRLDFRVAVVDIDEQLPYLNFFLNFNVNKSDVSKTDLLVKEGPLGVKLIGLNRYFLENGFDSEHKEGMIGQLGRIETEVDIILISASQKSLSNIRNFLKKSISDFLMLVPPDKDKMLHFYKVIKKIYLEDSLAKVGIVVINSDSMYEIDAVYDKISHVVKKFLDVELFMYGFLFKIKQGIESKNIVGYSFDSDQNDCISNIAEILVDRIVRAK